MQSRQLADLHSASVRQEQFRSATVRSSHLVDRRGRLSKALGDAVALKNPVSPPEPTVVVVSDDDGSSDFGSRNFDPAKWGKKPRSWW